MNITTLDRGAGLARVSESPPDGAASSILDVGIIQNDHRILAAKLQDDRSQIFCRRFCNALAGGAAAGEHDLVYTWIEQRRDRSISRGNDIYNIISVYDHRVIMY